MKNKLEAISKRCNELELEMSKPDVFSDQNRFRILNKEHSQIMPIVTKYQEYKKLKNELNDMRELLQAESDREMVELLRGEIDDLEKKVKESEELLMIMLLPKDPNSGKNIIMEIRAGTGGEEAALFAADLFRMYSRYVDSMGWRLELMDVHATEIGGYKEIIFSIAGDDVYDNLKFESGVHRVQRIPTTESGGRIHTSAVTVAVLPEAEESDVEIDPDDLRIDVYRSSGHGGQSVNTTDSAVRITHIPLNIVVTCQDEKSQHKNKAKAMRVLRARLYEKIERERLEKETEMRRSQVGSGDRSERIRTYNYPQSRVTDHRIGLTLYSLEHVLDGNMDDIIEPLKNYEIEQQLKSESL
jgi:peptide chain release factor 1